jgi:hypothetical protein
VQAVTEPAGKDHVARAERIAVVVNDGTLCSRQPADFSLLFALDGVKALAAPGEKGLLESMMATHVGNTPDEFQAIVRDWLATARHPKFRWPHAERVFQPMLELNDDLSTNVFRAYIVAGGASSSCGRGRRRSMASRLGR